MPQDLQEVRLSSVTGFSDDHFDVCLATAFTV
jgi:hypothetical protein